MGFKIYSNFMRNCSKDKRFTIRKKIVQEALENGIKPTASRFNMSKNTIKLWLKRFQEEGNDGLMDRRSGPKNIPHKTPQKLEEEIVKIRKTTPCYGPRRLKYFFNIPASIGAIQRIIKDNGLANKRKRRYQKKNDLREIKSKYKTFEKFQMDIKYLTDIPPYWEMMNKLQLPKFQYTIREVKSGMLFLGFADEISELHAETMASYVLSGIRSFYSGEMTVQTDNGVEFSGTTRKHENNQFRKTLKLFNVNNCYIPPGHCNANADVESIHHTVEEEFYNLTSFSSRSDFLIKAESYRLFYNLQRPNFSKKAKTPWLITQEDHPNTDFASLAQFINVIDLDDCLKLSKRGQTIPVFPEF